MKFDSLISEFKLREIRRAIIESIGRISLLIKSVGEAAKHQQKSSQRVKESQILATETVENIEN